LIYEATVALNSSYAAPFFVRDVTSPHGFVHVRPFPAATVRPKVPISVASFRLDADPDQLNLSLVRSQNFTDIPGQIAAWREPPPTTPIDFGIEVHSRGNSILPLQISSALSFPTIRNTTVDIGYALTNNSWIQLVETHNPLLCSIVLHSEYFETVAQPGAIVTIELDLGVAGPGKFEVSFPVTTNLTAPFYVHLRGMVVLPMVGFVDERGNTLAGLTLGPRGLQAVVFLKNLGRAGVNLSELHFTSPKFRLKTNCTRFLEPKHSCRVSVEAVTAMLESAAETDSLSVMAHHTMFVIPVATNISEATLAKMKMKRWANGLLLFSPLLEFVVWLVKTIFEWYRVRKRQGEWPAAVRSLTVAARASKELQVQIGRVNAQSSGLWVPAQHARITVTSESFAGMAALIASVM
jgi:hypothetical protein